MHQKVLNINIILAISVIAGMSTLKVQAQPAPLLFENVTIDRNFSSPITLRGISGGSVPAQKVAGRTETVNGPCVGFVDTEPDHTLVLKDFFAYLRLQAQSPQDTTMIVRGPGGTWCNDDAEGKDPGIAGEWLAGSYDVWVGSFDKDSYYPYILRISQER